MSARAKQVHLLFKRAVFFDEKWKKKYIDNIRHQKECTSEASAPPVQKGTVWF